MFQGKTRSQLMCFQEQQLSRHTIRILNRSRKLKFSVNNTYLFCLPLKPKLDEIREAQDSDKECAIIKTYVEEGWPSFMHHKLLLKPYWEVAGHLSIAQGLLLCDERLVIPCVMRI